MIYDSAKTQYFKETVLVIVGQALHAAGYLLHDDNVQQARGLVRFYKPSNLNTSAQLGIGWQLLVFEQSPIAQFRVELLRLNADQHTTKRTLSDVIWHDYKAHILPSDDFWWEFRTTDELPHAIAHAGKLLIGYGLPWLEMRSDSPA